MRIRWMLLIAGLLLTPSLGMAQTFVPPTPFAGPLAMRDDGGLYVGIQFIYMRTNRPLPVSQQIAVRGFKDLDGGTGVAPGTFVGSGEEALNTDQLRGPGNWQPGWDMWLGWKFQGGVAVELSWRHLVQAKYSAAAALLSPSFDLGGRFENTFLFSPVTNFSTDWAGNPQNIIGGTPATTFGIWNGASLMQMDLVQRYDIYSINIRVPITETSDHRVYGLWGPRIVWIWDRFHWRTVDADLDGLTAPETIANYSNMVSNRMWGVHAGFGNDWFLGQTPIGAFSCEFELEGGLYLDLAKTRASYEREDRGISSNRARRWANLVPAVEARLGLKWWVYEGITIEAGYDIQCYFNTIASPRPVDFNLSTVDPEYENLFLRTFHGMRFGITFTF